MGQPHRNDQEAIRYLSPELKRVSWAGDRQCGSSLCSGGGLQRRDQDPLEYVGCRRKKSYNPGSEWAEEKRQVKQWAMRRQETQLAEGGKHFRKSSWSQW